MQSWRLLNTGVATGAGNMAVDEAILIAHSRGEVPPTLRFYGWNPPTLSLGYFQEADKEVDFAACRARGIDVVRRLTGGRAVLHDQEVTYSLVAAENNPVVPGGVLESYLQISRGLVAGLENLGVGAEIVSHSRKSLGTAACFDSPSWYELVVGGRKLIGSAQTRKSGCLLQHGSILLDLDADKLFAVLKVANEAVRERLKDNFRQRACSLSDVMGMKPDFDAVCRAFADGIARGLEIDLVPGELTGAEKKHAEALVQEKYAQDHWNRKR
jgi:lipoate-protein ligase A